MTKARAQCRLQFPVCVCVLIQAESSLSRQASESGGAESEPSTLTQGDTSTSAGQEADDGPQDEQVGVKLPLLPR